MNQVQINYNKMSEEEVNKTGQLNKLKQQRQLQIKDTFTMVHYSKQFNYLTHENYHEQHLQLTSISLRDTLHSFHLQFNQCDRLDPNIRQEESNKGRLIKNRVRIVEIAGQNADSLQRIRVLLPIVENKMIEVIVKSQSDELRSILGNKHGQNVVQLYDKIGVISNLLFFNLSLIDGSDNKQKKPKQDENLLFSFQKLNNTEELSKITEEQAIEEQKQMKEEFKGKLKKEEFQKERSSQGLEQNQFLSEGKLAIVPEEQQAPERTISKQFSFNMIGGVDSSITNQDQQYDLPIHQPQKVRYQLPTLLEEAIAHSKASRSKKKKKDITLQIQEASEMQKQQIIADKPLKEQGRQMQKYRELLQKKELAKNRQKERQASILKYDYKPIDTIQKSQQEESIEVHQKQPKQYKTPLGIKTDEKVQSNIRSLQSTPESKLRGFTDKIYLKRLMRGSAGRKKDNNHQNKEKIDQKDKKSEGSKIQEGSKEKLERKPGFILSHRFKVDSLRKAPETKYIQSHSQTSKFQEFQKILQKKQSKKANLSIPLQKLEQIKQERRNSQGRYLRHENKDKRLPSNSRLQKISRSVSRTQKSGKPLKLSSHNAQCSIEKPNRQLKLSKHLIDVKVEHRNNRSVKDNTQGSEKRKTEQRSPQLHKSKASVLESNTSQVEPTDSQQVSNRKESLPHPALNAISQRKQQEFQVSFDILISNLSVNLYTKSFGRKFLELTQGHTIFSTDYLHGSHLLWVGRGYLFSGVTLSDSIQLCLKCEKDNYLKILGNNNVKVKDLLINHRQSFYQSYLFTPSSELLAVVILGFEVTSHRGVRKVERPERYYGSKTSHKNQKRSRTLGKTRRQKPSLNQFLDDQLEQDRRYGEQRSKRWNKSRLITEPVFQSISVKEKRIATEMSRSKANPSDN